MSQAVSVLDTDALINGLIQANAASDWKLEKHDESLGFPVKIYSRLFPSTPCLTFKVVSEMPDVDVETLASVLDDDLETPLSSDWDVTYHSGSVKEWILHDGDDASDRFRHVWVRHVLTKLPTCITPRDFLFSISRKTLAWDNSSEEKQLNSPRPFKLAIAYQSVDRLDTPSPLGFVRGRLLPPSGEIISQLPNGRVQLEHVMAVDSAGWFTPFVVNYLAKGSIITVYLNEAHHMARHAKAKKAGLLKI